MKKGFTLVELLATIVILGVIAVITIPIVGKIIDNNKFKSASLSALGYIEAANVYAAKFNDGILVNDEKFIYETYADEDALSKIKYAGVSPTYVKLEYDIDNKTVIDANMCIQNYNLVYHAGEVSKATFDYCHNSDSVLPIVNAYLDLNVAIIEITDEGSGVKAYCVTQTNKNDCTWQDTSGYHIEYEFETVGTYYIYGIDKARNVSLPFELTLTENDFCPYDAGKYWEFAYKGSIDEFEVPCKGLYKLEVWGAKGGVCGSGSVAGAGGYSSGYVMLDSREDIYIVAGGTNGYNGGGSGCGTGGGATHIGLSNNLLKDTDVDDLFIVAGGGGAGSDGTFTWWDDSKNKMRTDISTLRGGAGGGLNGGNGSSSTGNGCYYGYGASQSAGGLGGYGNTSLAGSYGQGGKGNGASGGGGGGFYGGGGGTSCNTQSAGGGGSGYIGGVPEIEFKGNTYSPSTTAGSNGDNGKAKITLIEY